MARQPIRYFYGAVHEQFSPPQLLEQAIEAEQSGFDGLACSDHFQPWWEPGHSGQAWVWLGAAATATDRIPIGSGVTAPVHRYHPALVAQAFASLETLAPGRAFLGVGSGESLNESPFGMDWPPVDEQLGRLEEALDVITRLLDGGRIDHKGVYFRAKDAVLHTRPERRIPVYVSAFGPEAARLAARYGDGVWTMADPDMAPAVLEAYRQASTENGRGPGEVIVQTAFSWAPDDGTAFRSSEVWKAANVQEFFSDDWHDPREMQQHAQEKVSDEAFRESFIISSDPDEHVERIRGMVERFEPTVVVLQNISGHDPVQAVRTYGERVLPQLRA